MRARMLRCVMQKGHIIQLVNTSTAYDLVTQLLLLNKLVIHCFTISTKRQYEILSCTFAVSCLCRVDRYVIYEKQILKTNYLNLGNEFDANRF